MSKPKSGRGSYTSKGKHSNVASGTLSAMRKSQGGGDRLINKMDAYLKGKNPWLTIENPNKTETSKRFIKVRANEHWGNPKERSSFKV